MRIKVGHDISLVDLTLSHFTARAPAISYGCAMRGASVDGMPRAGCDNWPVFHRVRLKSRTRPRMHGAKYQKGSVLGEIGAAELR